MSTATADAPSATTEVTPLGAEPPAGVEGFKGTFAWVDPRTLVVDPYNHRKSRTGASEDEAVEDTTEPDAELIASVCEIGVQTPLLLRPQADGESLGIIFGQRRFKAATI